MGGHFGGLLFVLPEVDGQRNLPCPLARDDFLERRLDLVSLDALRPDLELLEDSLVQEATTLVGGLPVELLKVAEEF